MASSERHSVSVKISFETKGEKSSTQYQRTFNGTDYEPSRLGLSEGSTPSKPEAGDYSYSGIHDHGPLPAPKEKGDMALLLGCVQAAKRASDHFLTDLIKKEKTHWSSQEGEDIERKRSRKEN